MEWCPTQKLGEAQPQMRVRLQNEGPGGSRRKNSRNCREQKSRTTFLVASNEGSKDPEEDGQDEGRGVTGNQLGGIQKIMAKKKSLSGEKKDEGAETNLDRFEGPEG